VGEIVAFPMMTRHRPFNTPFETGLRALYLLDASAPSQFDLQRLVHYDYLLVHSADPQGPPSLHPAVPHRSGELLIRRQLLTVGLDLMFSKELAIKTFATSGILFSASDLTRAFLDHLSSPYAKHLKQLAEWVNFTFRGYSDEELNSFINTQLGRWGAEFNRESILRRVMP
jgi:hypothetical protein